MLLYNILICIILFVFQSKLLEIGPADTRYDQNSIQQNQLYCPKLAEIKPQKSSIKYISKTKKSAKLTNNIDKSHQYSEQKSISELQLNLMNTINKFQDNYGIITYTCIIDPQLKTIRSNYTKRSPLYDQQANRGKQNVSNSFGMFSDGGSQSKRTTNFDRTNECLRNITLDSINVFEKQIFQSEYSEISSVHLFKWDQNSRIPLLFSQAQCIETLKNCHGSIANIVLIIFILNAQHQMKLISYSQNNQQIPLGLKIFINGTRRLFPISPEDIIDNNKRNLSRMLVNFSGILQHKQNIQPCFLLYNLTGWIPEVIQLDTISINFQLMKKLSHNLAAFTSILQFIDSSDSKINYILTKINLLQETVEILSTQKLTSINSIQAAMQTISWSKLIAKCSKLCINWNPSFYGFNSIIQSEFNDSQDDCTYPRQFHPQIVVTIPPTDSQLEIRIFIEQHLSTYDDTEKIFQIQLYEYIGERESVLRDEPIKKVVSSNSRFLTEIFIFEESKLSTKYIIVIIPKFQQTAQTCHMQFSSHIYSFKELVIEKLCPYTKSAQKQLKDYITISQNGRGLNSPHFYHNPCYYVEVPRCQVAYISTKINEVTANSLWYKILLVPNPKKVKNITLLLVNNLASSDLISTHFSGDGFLEFQPKYSSYILFLVCHSISTKIPIDLILQCDDIQNSTRTNPNLLVLEKLKYSEPQHNYSSFKWTKANSGPRKRTINNTNDQYYPEIVFQQYFKNPYFDQILETGVYQFHVKSQSYQISYWMTSAKIREQPNLSQLQQLKMQEQIIPPGLSFSIYEIKSENNDNINFKIILDDEIYVPFGFGYWTKRIHLNKGTYRLVLSKLQKQDEDGLFCINRVDNLH